MTYAADTVAKTFNSMTPVNWKARAYMKARAVTGVFNAVNFSYKNGMVAILMDCDVPLGQGFQVKFHSFTGAFGDYLMAIQKGIYMVLTTLRNAGIADNVPGALEINDILFALRKDGTVVYCAIVGAVAAVLADTTDARDLAYVPDFEEKLSADDLI